MALMKFPKTSPNSLRALATEVQLELNGGKVTDDTNYSLRHIESEILHVHGIVQKELDERDEAMGILPSDARLRIFKCKKLVETDDFYCKCTDPDKKGVFKKVVLPKLYEYKNQSFIKYFGNTHMSVNFTPVSNISQMNILPTLTKRPAFFMIENTAYVSIPLKFALICEVTVIGIPENPNETDGKCFDPWSQAWNVDRYVKGIVKDRVLKRLGNNMLTTSQNVDNRNNAQDGNIVTSLFGN